MVSFLDSRAQWQAGLDSLLEDLIRQHHQERQNAAERALFPYNASRYDSAIDAHLKPLATAFAEQDYLKAAFEYVAKEKVPALLDNVHHLYLLFDVLHECSVLGIADSVLCFNVIEESCDFLTLTETEAIFAYLEDRMPILSVDMLPNKGKGLTLLRICNELIRRSSKTRNTVFCGRIRLFLASIFPPDERSGVNLNKEYNLDNVTLYETKETEEDAMDIVMEEKSDALVPTEEQANAIYEPFWALQDFFRNPPALLQGNGLGTFEKNMTLVLTTFAEIAKHEQAAAATQKKKEDTQTPANSYFFVKFLTNKKLLNLELSDVAFRRHILVQALIVLDFMVTHAASHTQKVPTRGNQPRVTLSEAQEKIVKELRGNILTHLLTFGPSPNAFVRAVLSFLRLEDFWQAWKANSCPSFTKHATDEAIIDRTGGKVQFTPSAPRTYPPGRLPYLGKPALERLWKEAGDMDEILHRIEKEEASSTKNKAKEMVNVMMNYEGYERKQLGETYAWKVQRLVLRNELTLHPSFQPAPTGNTSSKNSDAGKKSGVATPIAPLDVELYLYALHPELQPPAEETPEDVPMEAQEAQ